MANFRIAHQQRMLIEGGSALSLHKEDTGNWTGGKIGAGQLIGSKYGISAPTLCTWLKRTATADEMKNLDHETAEAIYKKWYWDPMRGDEIKEQAVANAIYNSVVPMGKGQGIKLAENAWGIAMANGKLSDADLDILNNKEEIA